MHISSHVIESLEQQIAAYNLLYLYALSKTLPPGNNPSPYLQVMTNESANHFFIGASPRISLDALTAPPTFCLSSHYFRPLRPHNES